MFEFLLYSFLTEEFEFFFLLFTFCLSCKYLHLLWVAYAKLHGGRI